MEPTAEQIAIQTSDEATIVVQANAGAAKTTTLAFRIAEGLRRGIAPSKILALTYTDPARTALRAALLKVGVSAQTSNGLWIETFESFAAYVLRKFEATQAGGKVPVKTEPEQFAPYVWRAVERLRAKLDICWDDDLILPADSHSDSEFVECFLSQSLRLKGTLAVDRAVWDGEKVSPDLAIDLNCDYTILRTLIEYERIRFPEDDGVPIFRGPGDAAYDLARLIADPDGAVRLDDLDAWPRRTEVLMVDEMHDLNRGMFTILCALLRSPSVYFCGVGDADQVIHASAGAQRYFMEDGIRAETSRTVADYKLTLTHRFGDSLSTMAGAFARKPYRSKDELDTSVTVREYGGSTKAQCHALIVREAQDWKSRKLKMNDFAILLRHASQSVLIENALLDAELPYVTSGFDSYIMRPEVLLVRGLLAIAAGNFDAIQDPKTRRRIVQEMVFFCGVRLDFADVADESQAAQLNEAMRHVSLEPAALVPFFEHQVLKNAKPGIAERLQAARAVAAAASTPDMFDRFLDALQIESWAREVWVEKQRQQDAIANLQGLRDAATSFNSASAFFLSLNAAELKQQALIRKSSAFLTLASIPSVKGLEFGHVVMPYLSKDEFPAKLDQSITDERNLFYVGVTRARQALTLLVDADDPSPFIAEMKAHPAR